MDDRIEAFLEWFVNDKLAHLTDEEFNMTIATLIKIKSLRWTTVQRNDQQGGDTITKRRQ